MRRRIESCRISDRILLHFLLSSDRHSFHEYRSILFRFLLRCREGCRIASKVFLHFLLTRDERRRINKNRRLYLFYGLGWVERCGIKTSRRTTLDFFLVVRLFIHQNLSIFFFYLCLWHERFRSNGDWRILFGLDRLRVDDRVVFLFLFFGDSRRIKHFYALLER